MLFDALGDAVRGSDRRSHLAVPVHLASNLLLILGGLAALAEVPHHLLELFPRDLALRVSLPKNSSRRVRLHPRPPIIPSRPSVLVSDEEHDREDREEDYEEFAEEVVAVSQ